MPTLISISDDGIERRTPLGGTAAGWHAALDEMVFLYDENVCAGLHRTIRVTEAGAQAEPGEAEEKETASNSEQLLLMAA